MRNVLLLVSLSVNILLGYRLLSQEERVVIQEKEIIVEKMIRDEVKLVESALLKEEPVIAETTPLASEHTAEDVTLAYQKLEKDFKEKFNKFTVENLRLTDSEVAYYLDLKMNREKEIHDNILSQVSENDMSSDGMYIFSSEDMIALGKINEKYNLSLKAYWGEDAFGRYQTFIKEYNQSQQEKASQNQVYHIIDF